MPGPPRPGSAASYTVESGIVAKSCSAGTGPAAAVEGRRQAGAPLALQTGLEGGGRGSLRRRGGADFLVEEPAALPQLIAQKAAAAAEESAGVFQRVAVGCTLEAEPLRYLRLEVEKNDLIPSHPGPSYHAVGVDADRQRPFE